MASLAAGGHSAGQGLTSPALDEDDESPSAYSQPPKKKIRRLRPLRSCVSCNKRKIKCDRERPCGQCSKRGDGEKCSLGGASLLSGLQDPSSLVERLSQLESRVEELEAINPYLRSNDSQSGAEEEEQKPEASNGKALGCDTEEAALVLESLCNVTRGFQAAALANSRPAPTLAGDMAARAEKSTVLFDTTAESSGYATERSRDIRLRVLKSPHFPSRQLCDHIIKTYFRLLDPYWHIHVTYLFETEYQEFWALVNEGRLLEVDPAWLALLLVTLALGLQLLDLPLPEELGHRNQTPEDILALSDVWIDDVQECLKAADWVKRPQVRTIQTIVLLCGYFAMESMKDPSGACFAAAAIRMAQSMGWHKLSADDHQELPDDPAVPTGKNIVKSQLAKRLWLSLVVLEHVYALRIGALVPLSSEPFTTPLPANVDDIDLNQPTLQEKPAWKRTSTSSLLLRWTMAQSYRKLLCLRDDLSAADKYTHVLEEDAMMRQWLSEAPSSPQLSDSQDYETYQSAMWQHWAMVTEVHSQILHVHRPYMVQGYSDERYSLSTKVCLESAKVICDSRQYLATSKVDERFWWAPMRFLSAAIVIFIDVFQAIDAGCSHEEIKLKKAEIPGLYSTFQTRLRSHYPTVRYFAGAAIRVLDNLIEAERQKQAVSSRRGSLGANATVEDGDEPVGRVFQRIAKNMSDSRLSSPSIVRSGSVEGTTRITGPDRVRGPVVSLGSHPQNQPAVNGDIERMQDGSNLRNKAIKGIADNRSGRSGSGTPTMVSSSSHSTVASSAYNPHPHASTVLEPGSAGLLTPHGHPNGGEPFFSPSSAEYQQSGVSMSSMHEYPRQVQSADVLHQQSMSYHQPQAQHMPQHQSGPAHHYPAQQQQHEYLEQQPITWDTSHFFNPDPSDLLRSMGYKNGGAHFAHGLGGHEMPLTPTDENGLAQDPRYQQQQW